MRHPAFRRACQIIAAMLLGLGLSIAVNTTLLQG